MPKVAGRTASWNFPTFHHTLRRVRVAKNSPIHPLLAEAGIPYETDVNDPYTDVFEYPILQGPAKPATDASLWEQALILVTLQREWSDNAVSNTLYFKPKWQLTEHRFADLDDLSKEYRGNETEHFEWDDFREEVTFDAEGHATEFKQYSYNPFHEEDDIEPVLSFIAPLIKSVSLLPHTAEGVYQQMPESSLTPEEYEERLKSIRPIDWSKLTNHIPEGEAYCQGDRCEIGVSK